MKKLLLLAVAATFVFSFASTVDAAEKATGKPVYKYWTPFQLGFFPGVPSYVNNSRVIGIKTGWPISGGKNSQLDGFESSWIYSGTDYTNGLQASIFMNISKELKGFERVALKAGESKRISFTLTPEHLRYYNIEMERVVEPGTFKVMVGPSSQDKDLLTAEFEVK